MKITILFFATFRDLAQVGQAELELAQGAKVGDLKKALVGTFPALNRLIANALISINQEFAFEGDLVPDQAEVGVFPPVSGGCGFTTLLRVTRDVLDLDDLVEKITLDTTGAVCCFSGMVRGKTVRGDAHETSSLEYEAYIPMAEAKMAQVANEIRARWPAIEGIAIVQRIGRLEPKTPTVFIACAAAHRDTGVFEAARYGIDRLKEIVPIWKKEIGPHGEIWVEGDYHPHPGD